MKTHDRHLESTVVSGDAGRFFGIVIVVFSFVLLAGCASADFDYPRVESRATSNTEHSQLGRAFEKALREHPEKSGFLPIEDGVDALAYRFTLALAAEHSIDAQYFLVHDDAVGRLFIDSLLRAADRGVRVRLLIDDTHTSGHDFDLAILDSHANIEVRVFNPFGNRTSKLLNVADVRRVTRRMHNKSFTVDNQVTIVGGRNIGAEYFGASGDASFGDLDVVSVGPIVAEVSAMFDEYWNHRAALPILALTRGPTDPGGDRDAMRRALALSNEQEAAGPYAVALESSILTILQSQTSLLTFAPYKLVFDSPDKSQPDAAETAESILSSLQDSISSAAEELIVITPYFVLSKDDLNGLRLLREKGVEITVLTNSLASNNHTVSHSGYKSSRKPLLEMGARLLELRADPNSPGHEGLSNGSRKRTLHTKAFVVDRKRVFVGSFNWNQRSANLDTEMGVIIESAEIAEEFARRVNEANLAGIYELHLDSKNRIRWTSLEGGTLVTLEKDPQSTWWQRFSAGFLGLLPIKSQL